MKNFLIAITRSKSAMFGWVFLLLFVLMALLGPWIAPYDPVRMDLAHRMTAPELSLGAPGSHVFGTDQLGRDILSRLIAGSRVTLAVAALAVIVGGVVGVLVGLCAGYYGKWVDRVLMRLADVQLSFPLMLLAILIVAALGPSLPNLIMVLALTTWVRYARIVRGEVLSLREREFVLAARAAGASSARIVLRHLLPNVMTAVLVVGTLELARVIILESALSFLGLGVQPPSPSWGRMLADGRSYLESAWWLATIPGLAILLTVLSVNLVGDWLRDHFDPRLVNR
ncbi:MAG: nickel transporter permease [Burkholderiales bacterium]